MRLRTRITAALCGGALAAGALTVAAAGSSSADQRPSASPAAPQAEVDGTAAALGITADQARTRLAQQDQAHRVYQSLGSRSASFAGHWFDAATGTLTVAVTDDATADAVRAAGARPVLVARDRAQLTGLLGQVRGLVGAGVPGVYSWGVDDPANAVTVHVNDSAATAATDALLARLTALGQGVRVVHTDTQQHQQAGTLHTGDPWWPGSESNCSVGFTVTDSGGAKNFLTAGHCTNDANQAAYGQSGQQNKIGTSNVGGTHSVNAYEGDMGLVSVTEPNWNLSGDVNTWGQPAVGVTGSVDAMVGDTVCHSGNTSHWQCGTVKYTHKDVDYGGGLVIGDLTWTTACSLGGDSGGGWLVGTKAAGLHDGGPSQCVTNPSDGDLSLFQPVNEALQKWNVSLVTSGGSTDTAPPSAPANPRSTGVTANSVSLAWDASTDNVGVTGYTVYNGSAVAATVTGTTATVSGLSPDTSYTFTVKARDAAGNLSAASAGVTARTQPGSGGDTQPPTAPANLRSTGVTANSVSLAWDASTDDVGVTGYDVYNGSAVVISVTGTSATVAGLAANTAYSFTVVAKDAAGNRSGASRALSVTTSGGSSGRTFTNGTDYPIQDYTSTYSRVGSTATGAAASSVSLSISINHTCLEDLGISLIAPNGAVYAVKYSGSGNYACTPWTGAKAFTVRGVSAAASGQWTLRVTDYGPGDTGVLDSWSITL